MTTLTISAGSKEGAFRGENGSYSATLVSVEKKGPFPSKQPKFPGETFELYEWAFAIDDAEDPDNPIVWASSSTRITPKSKAYGYIVALFGGKEPPVGTDLDIEQHLVGRQAMVTIVNSPEGYVDVTSVAPLPKVRGGAPKPTQPPDSSLPF